MYIHTCWVCRKCVIKQRNSSAIAISSPLNAVDIGKFSAIFLSDTIERFSHANELFNLRMDYINSRGGHAFHESGQFCVVLYTPCGVSETRLTSFQPWNRIKYDGDQSDYYFTLNLEPGNWSNPTLGRDEDIWVVSSDFRFGRQMLQFYRQSEYSFDVTKLIAFFFFF